MKTNHVRSAAVAVALIVAGSSGAVLAQEATTDTVTTTETSRDGGFDDWGLLGLLGLAGLLGRKKPERHDVHIDHTRNAGR